jgi:hypothetical protein
VVFGEGLKVSFLRGVLLTALKLRCLGKSLIVGSSSARFARFEKIPFAALQCGVCGVWWSSSVRVRSTSAEFSVDLGDTFRTRKKPSGKATKPMLHLVELQWLEIPIIPNLGEPLLATGRCRIFIS